MGHLPVGSHEDFVLANSRESDHQLETLQSHVLRAGTAEPVEQEIAHSLHLLVTLERVALQDETRLHTQSRACALEI